jgi:hypothetical protein
MRLNSEEYKKCRFCICWGTSRQGQRLGSHNGWNWSVNAVPHIVTLAFLAAPPALITCLLGSAFFFFFLFVNVFNKKVILDSQKYLNRL